VTSSDEECPAGVLDPTYSAFFSIEMPWGRVIACSFQSWRNAYLPIQSAWRRQPALSSIELVFSNER